MIQSNKISRIIDRFIQLTLIAGFPFFLNSCYYDKEELLYGINKCDTSNVSYNIQVKTTLNNSCNSCHGGTASSGGGIKLDDYASVQAQVTNDKLLGSIQHAAGYFPMPKGAPKLSDCKIAEIRTWIRNGALNN